MKISDFDSISDEEVEDLYKRKLYKSFRTGLTFRSVRRDLAIEQQRRRENFDYFFVTRSTVLGRMREIKLKLFELFEYSSGEVSRKEMIDYLIAPSSNGKTTDSESVDQGSNPCGAAEEVF